MRNHQPKEIQALYDAALANGSTGAYREMMLAFEAIVDEAIAADADAEATENERDMKI